jgi:transcription elongation factor Elf1
MKSLFDDLPTYCPSCGHHFEHNTVEKTSFFNGYALYCPQCRHKFQYLARHIAEERLVNELHPIFTAP